MKELPQRSDSHRQKAKNGDTQVTNSLQNTEGAWQKAHALIAHLLQDDRKHNQAQAQKR